MNAVIDGDLSRQERARHLTPSPLVRARCSRPSAPKIERVRLVADADEELDASSIEREFPTVAVMRSETPARGDFVIDDFAWRGAFDFRSVDDLVDQGRPETIAVRGADAAGVAMEVMGRFQRLVWRRNEASSTPLFDAVLDVHAALYDASHRMDLEHALDTWQWMLRLDPNIGLAPQIAALFHEVDRLDSAPEERIEHRVHRTDQRGRIDRGRGRALARLRNIGVSEDDAGLARALVIGCDSTSPDAATLDDADALSFLSLISPAYADHFGVAQTRRKLTFTLDHMGEAARSKLALIRLRPDVDRLVSSLARRGRVLA